MENLGPDVPWHFTAFHPDFKMLDKPHTPPATLRRAREIARSKGLHYLYTGNVHDRDGGSTLCPGCGELLIERDWYEPGEWNLNKTRRQDCLRHFADVDLVAMKSQGDSRNSVAIGIGGGCP